MVQRWASHGAVGEGKHTKTMENHHFSWVNPLMNGDFQYFSIAKLKKTRGFYGIRILGYTMVYRIPVYPSV
jgi:hypothetical protein